MTQGKMAGLGDWLLPNTAKLIILRLPPPALAICCGLAGSQRIGSWLGADDVDHLAEDFLSLTAP